MLSPNSRISIQVVAFDTNWSVNGQINQINECRQRTIEDSQVSDKDLESVFFMEVEFGGEVNISALKPLPQCHYEPKFADGNTPMGEAICKSIPMYRSLLQFTVCSYS